MPDWSQLVVPSVAELEPLDVERTVAGVLALANHADGLKLDWNENLFGPLAGVREAVRDDLEGVWRYPIAPYQEFRVDVAQALGTSPERIAPGHGTQALIGTVASTFLRPGDHVVLPEITFYLYAQVSAARGAVLHRVPMRDLHIDLRAVADTATEVSAKLVWICDPNNPTGLALDPSEWDDFLDSLPETCVVVADEAYVDFLPADRRVPRVANVEAGRPLVVLRSFSKFFGLAGLRLGYAIADEAAVAFLAVVEEPFNVNCAALAAGRASLRATGAAEGRREEVAEARVALAAGLREAGAEPYPSETNFVLARIDGDDEAAAAELARRGVLVRPARELGLPGHLRIAVCPLDSIGRVKADLRAVIGELPS